jgi:hypothetical protein
MLINEPCVLAEVETAFAAYEAALMANDAEGLDRLFWDSPLVLRYGAGENLYGQAEIAAYRRQRPGGAPLRRLTRTLITTFGRDFATANTEFVQLASGRTGRQSHSWARLDEGWRIVAAHVSMLETPP